VESEEDERALGVFLDAIEQAQAMDRADVRRQAAEDFDTERIADQVVGALGIVRASTDFDLTAADSSQEI
jgi:hypothetical protein